jgi:hypothetical protein
MVKPACILRGRAARGGRTRATSAAGPAEEERPGQGVGQLFELLFCHLSRRRFLELLGIPAGPRESEDAARRAG